MFWISTDALMHLVLGSDTPDAAFKKILKLGTGFSTMLAICVMLDCANKDMHESESSITS